MKVLFLDIDGVLNDHAFDLDAQSCAIDSHCAHWLNSIAAATDCKIVLSSAWRYMILNGAMTLEGFRYMLRTHGVAKSAADAIIGTTRADKTPTEERKDQILDWIDTHRPEKWIAVDDLYLGIRQIQTDPKVGLTQRDAQEIIRVLS